MAEIKVEVVYALPDQQLLLSLEVEQGTTAREVVLLSDLAECFPDLDLSAVPLGIFGKLISQPEGRVLQEGERVEVYRPLLADPKDVRKARAAKAKAQQG